MTKKILLLAALPMFLTACDEAMMAGMTNDPTSGFIQELPEGVLEIAAPYQDLTAVKVDPIDGCYVYRHVGPVETTLLPLRAKNGRPICTRAPA